MSHNAVRRKLEASELFNCSDLTEFIATIIQILPYKGISMSRFYKCEYEGVRFLTKVCFYRKEPFEIYGKGSKNVMPQTDAEINILKTFKKKLLDTNITNCILEIVFHKICTDVSKLSPKEKMCDHLMIEYDDNIPEDDVNQLMCKYNDWVKDDLAYNKCAFVILEQCDMSLDDYLRKSINTSVSMAVFKTLLFQIIYTMYAINKIYPKFRHYDLHTDNILLKFDPNYKFRATNPKFIVFHMGGDEYSVPYFGIIPKIIDFGFSSLPEEGYVSNATEDRRIMFERSDNDILLLFRFIYLRLAASGGDKLGRVDKLMSQLEPNRAYVHYYPAYIRKIQHKIPTYEQMVKNKVFDEYKKFKPTKGQIYNEFAPVD
ncbi:Putative serine/threonine-protein kinase [Pacmanvirus A23]|uniref:Putative serine/threonine-protein kinase n=1 Tax=Pacmanvirus A23 TaxID=1932881 RepID=UPI000A091EE0|nr:Putative serine/threonine-protein kinase [Pacmanvirus A23]SIP86129.1 Putative serine/threonine-protein kinase [Pacmanvirus A23]